MTIQETVILVVEDEPVVRNLLQIMLSREGYAVLTANDGLEAMELIHSFKDPIHLLLTDVQMPRMDGSILAELVREHRPEIKIIMMSGQLTSVILKENIPDAFLRKPFIPPTVLRCIQDVLTGSHKGVCREL